MVAHDPRSMTFMEICEFADSFAADLRSKLSAAEEERQGSIKLAQSYLHKIRALEAEAKSQKDWKRVSTAAEAELARVRALLGRIVEFDAVRHILGLNHRYESGCKCEMCEVEAALQERERKGESG